jgi:hypothetical protein
MLGGIDTLRPTQCGIWSRPTSEALGADERRTGESEYGEWDNGEAGAGKEGADEGGAGERCAAGHTFETDLKRIGTGLFVETLLTRQSRPHRAQSTTAQLHQGCGKGREHKYARNNGQHHRPFRVEVFGLLICGT